MKEYPPQTFRSSAFARGIGMAMTAVLSTTQQAWLRVFWNNHKNVPAFIIFTLIRLLWAPFEKLKVYLSARNLNEDPKNLVEIKRVLWSMKVQPIDVPRTQYYLATHESFADGSVLMNENFFLAKVFSETVVFVDFGKPVRLHYTASKATFLWEEIIHDAVRLIYVPIHVFHRVSDSFPEEDKIDNRSEDLVILYGSGRCGSTLFAKMIEAVSKEHLVYSDVTTMFDLMSFNLRIPQKDLRRIMLSSLRFLCKSYDSKRRKIFIKPLCLSVCMSRHIQDVAPKAKFIFLHRDPIQNALAHERAFGMSICFRGYQLIHWLGGDWPERFNQLIKFYRNPLIDAVASRTLPYPSIFETCLIIYSYHILTHREQAKEFPYPEMRYESIFEEPEKCVRRFLSLAGLNPEQNEDLVWKAMETLKTDSQKDRYLSQSQLKGFPVTEIDNEVFSRAVRFCKELGMGIPERARNGKKTQSLRIFPRNLSALNGF